MWKLGENNHHKASLPSLHLPFWWMTSMLLCWCLAQCRCEQFSEKKYGAIVSRKHLRTFLTRWAPKWSGSNGLLMVKIRPNSDGKLPVKMGLSKLLFFHPKSSMESDGYKVACFPIPAWLFVLRVFRRLLVRLAFRNNCRSSRTK